MDIFDEFWLFVRKYLFSILLILAGLIFLPMGISSGSEAGNLVQTSNFVLGAIALLFLGFVSLFFIVNTKLSRIITIIASLVFLGGSAGFLALNYNTVTTTIIKQNQIKESESLAKQGLADIKELQEAYEKKYKTYATSLAELERFAKFDSISVLVKAVGDLPEDKMTPAEARALGYRYPKPWTEKDALKLGKIIRDYDKVPVAQNIFSNQKSKEFRAFDFDVNKIGQMRTIDNKGKEYRILTGKVDTTVTVLIQALPPYGPQEIFNITDTFQVGSLSSKEMKSNWK